MSAASALGWLALASARGRLRQLARRVRSPRHFFGMLAGVAWLLFLFATNRRSIGRVLEQRLPLGPAELVPLGAVAVLAVFVAVAWMLVPEGNVLGFTEPEVHVLFAAPVTRRQLVAYKLAPSAIGTLVFVVLVTVVFGRGDAGDRVTLAAGLWIAFFTSSLHGAGAGLTRAALVEHGVRGVRRRLLTLAIVAAVPVAAWAGWHRAPPLEAFGPGVEGLAEWSRALLRTAPLSWVVAPLRWLLGPALASGGSAFLAALPAALAVLAVHLAWVLSSGAAFQELTLRNAARSTARLEAVRSGVIPLAGRAGRRRSFTLRADGRPEGALAWKAVVRGTRGISIPLVATALAFALTLVTALVLGRSDRGSAAPFVAIVSLLFFAMAVFFGPHVFSGDLRRDAPHLELLRALPLRGRQVLLAEMVVPLLQTAAVQGVLATLWCAFAGGLFPGTRADHAAVALALTVGGAAASAVTFAVANGLVVLYPDWAGKQRRTVAARSLRAAAPRRDRDGAPLGGRARPGAARRRHRGSRRVGPAGSLGGDGGRRRGRGDRGDRGRRRAARPRPRLRADRRSGLKRPARRA